MERLNKVTVLIVLVVWCLSRVGEAQDKCSLAIRVVSPNGRRPEVPITVREQSGRTIDKEQEGSDVTFCDLGILPVDVEVGSDGICNQVTVHNVPVSLDRTYLLKVTYDPEACLESPPPPVPICHVLFRVRDTRGRWLAGVPLVVSRPIESQLRTDRYGRAEFTARAGVDISGLISADGFNSAKFDFRCAPSEGAHEEVLRLQRR